MPRAELVVLDLAEGTVVRAQAEPLLMSQLSPIMIKWAWRAEDSSAVYYLSQPRNLHTLTLHRLAASSRWREPCFDTGGMGLDPEPIAALGFVVVAVDGRGTPGGARPSTTPPAATWPTRAAWPTMSRRCGSWPRPGRGWTWTGWEHAAAGLPPRPHPDRPRVARRAVRVEPAARERNAARRA
jgi:hypothetical protein